MGDRSVSGSVERGGQQGGTMNSASIVIRGLHKSVMAGCVAILAGFAVVAVPAGGPLNGLLGGQAMAQEDDERPDYDEAKDFIQNVANRAVSILQREDVNDAERLRVFQAILEEAFNIPFLARLALGRYRSRATEEQLAEYEMLFGDFVLNRYSTILNAYSGEEFVVTSAREAGGRDVYVRSDIVGSRDQTSVDWRVRKYGDSLKIIDVVVENISMVISQREEFASVINREGFEGLLRRLRNMQAETRERLGGEGSR